MEEKKGKSKLFLLFVFLLLGYATWYFFTQFDKKQLSGLLPFSEEQSSQNNTPNKADNNAELSIENVIAATQTDAPTVTDSEIKVQETSVNKDDNRS